VLTNQGTSCSDFCYLDSAKLYFLFCGFLFVGFNFIEQILGDYLDYVNLRYYLRLDDYDIWLVFSSIEI
jgi:hypothetical protein